MKPITTTLKIILLAAALAPASALAAESAEAIMTKVDHAVRKSFTTQLAHVMFTTCKYLMVNGTATCSGPARVVVAENAKKIEIVDGVYNDASLSIVRDPAGDRGTSLLIYEYGQRGKDNDNWLYLPALAKVNRIIANEDEGGSVFGSEFSIETTENPEARKIYDYTYRIVEETDYDERPVWVVELRPTAEKASKTRYEKVVTWIDKKTFLPLKEALYRNGKIHKLRTQSKLKQIDGVYVATRVVMINRSTNRISQMDKAQMRHNVDIPDEFLTQRALTDFAFRDRYLSKFRDQLSK